MPPSLLHSFIHLACSHSLHACTPLAWRSLLPACSLAATHTTLKSVADAAPWQLRAQARHLEVPNQNVPSIVETLISLSGPLHDRIDDF